MNFKKVSVWHEFANCPAIGVDVCKMDLDIVGLGGSISFCISSDSEKSQFLRR